MAENPKKKKKNQVRKREIRCTTSDARSPNFCRQGRGGESGAPDSGDGTANSGKPGASRRAAEGERGERTRRGERSGDLGFRRFLNRGAGSEIW